MKKAFTLIELMVVIGIIGILTAALLGAFGGATESARAVKCMTNLRNLALAVNAVGSVPAGSYESYVVPTGADEDKSPYYKECVGWISWLSNHGDPYASHTRGKAKPTSHQTVEVCPFYGTGSREDEFYAVTNGALWQATGRNREIYVCPKHRSYRSDHKQPAPIWSYVMNMRFGYDTTKGSDAAMDQPETWRRQRKTGKFAAIPRDRLLMFAELPALDLAGGNVTPHADGDIWQCDCTLHYRATVDGVKLGDWNGKAESIGFNHKVGKGSYCGHVAFADGHVTKIVYDPHRNSGLKPEELTALLCEGFDLSTDGSSWQKIPGQD